MASSCRGYSKAQICFFKILRIISSTPPTTTTTTTTTTKGIGIDLNLRFCSTAESESSRSDGTSATAQSNNNNEETAAAAAAEEEEEEDALPEKSVDVLEKLDNNNEVVNHVETESEEAASFRGRDSNCLDLLIEAARVVSGKDDESDSEGESRTRKQTREKRKERWVVVDLYGGVVEETEPVVRSKRGRSQALPYRFRDSVVEPLKRATRSQRPSSTATNHSKRLLRSSPTT